jgi:hypothetical protein
MEKIDGGLREADGPSATTIEDRRRAVVPVEQL